MSFSIPITEKFFMKQLLVPISSKNKYSKNRHPSELAYNFEDGEPTFSIALIEMNQVIFLVFITAQNPIHSNPTANNVLKPYFDQTFKYDIYTLKLNANRQIYKYSGQVFRRNRFISGAWDEIKKNIEVSLYG